MELSPKQQVTELIRKFSKILLVTHARPDGDALGSLLAVRQVLLALGKEVTAVVTDPIPEMYRFLPGLDGLSQTLTGSADFVVTIDVSKTPVDKLKYNTADGKLNIVVTPKRGAYTPADVSTKVGVAKFDMIVVLDAPDLDRIGAFYEQNPDLFYETPVVNIDHHPSNDYFGAVNLVDLTATSTSEILVGVIESLGDSLMTEDVATQLLTGLITDTGSFQNSNTTPKSLTVSAQLVAGGGRQQEIVQHVYKTKPLSTLKLWGRALTKLQYDESARLVWSTVSQEDFANTGGTPTDAKSVIDALMSSAPDAEVILLLRQSEDGKVDGSVRTTKGVDATKIVGMWGGGGHTGAAGFEVAGSLAEVETAVVTKIRDWQRQRLSSCGGAAGAGRNVPRSTNGRPAANSGTRPAARAAKTAPTKTAGPASKAAPPAAGAPHQSQGRVSGTQSQAPASTAGHSTQPGAAAPGSAAADRQRPLTDAELDAYFRKTLGSQDQVVDQDQAPRDDSRS